MKSKLENMIIECIKEVKDIEVNGDTTLIGSEGILDSLDFVNLLVSIEEYVSDEYDKEIIIADEKAFSRSKSPFKNVNSLCEYIIELLEA